MIERPEANQDLLRARFEEQFNHPIVVGEGKDQLKVYDLDPTEKTSEMPVIFCPGWIQNSKNHKEAAYGLYKGGHRVVVPDALHGVSTNEVEDIPQAELRKAAMLVESLDRLGIQKADAVAHSEGGFYLSIAAKLWPERFRNLVMVDPAGIIGKDNLFGMMKRNIQEVRADITDRLKNRPAEFTMVGDKNNEYFINTLGATLKEVKAMVAADIREMLKGLKTEGHLISIIHGADDKLFPMDRVQKNIDTSMVHGFYSVAEGHQRYFQDPSKYAKVSNHALAAMEKLSH